MMIDAVGAALAPIVRSSFSRRIVRRQAINADPLRL
jgi:hypothetical protein